MAVIQPTINQQNAEIAKNRAIAKALRESERYDLPPDASVQVGPYRHVVKMHPLTALVNGLRSGYSAYLESDAAKQAADLEDRKLQAVKDSFQNNQFDYAKAAESGAFPPETLAKLLSDREMRQQKIDQQQSYFQPVATNQGFISYNARTGQYEPMRMGENPLLQPASDPTLQGEIQRKKTANQGVKLQDASGSEGFYSGRQANPQEFGTNPIEQPAPIQSSPIPQKAQFEFNDPASLAAFYNSPEGKAILSSGMVKGPTIAQQESVKTEENIRQKKAEVKIGLDADKAKSQQEREQGAIKTADTLTDMMRYLYPNGQIVRSADGRLAPPSEQMILGTGPIDRLKMGAQSIGLHSDAATNTEMLRSKASRLVTDAVNGKLGAGVSNADMGILNKAQGLLDSAQDIKTIYEAVSDIEQTVNRILQKNQQTQQGGLSPEEQRELEELRARFKR